MRFPCYWLWSTMRSANQLDGNPEGYRTEPWTKAIALSLAVEPDWLKKCARTVRLHSICWLLRYSFLFPPMSTLCSCWIFILPIATGNPEKAAVGGTCPVIWRHTETMPRWCNTSRFSVDDQKCSFALPSVSFDVAFFSHSRRSCFIISHLILFCVTGFGIG